MELVALGLRFGLGLVFLNASVPKLLAPRDFEDAVSNYRLLPPRFVPVIARWLPRLELACALALLAGIGLQVVSVIVAILLIAFAVAVTSSLVRGQALDCGCSGSVAPKKIGWGLVLQDVVYAAMAFALALRPPLALSMSLPWESHPSTAVSVSDSVAVIAISILAILGYLLLGEALRYHRGARAFRLRLQESQR